MMDLLTFHYTFAASLHVHVAATLLIQATLTAEFDHYLCSVAARECDQLVDKRRSRLAQFDLVSIRSHEIREARHSRLSYNG